MKSSRSWFSPLFSKAYFKSIAFLVMEIVVGLFSRPFYFLHFYMIYKNLSKYKNAFSSSKWKTRNIFSVKASSRFSLTLCKLKNVLMWTHFLAPVENWLPSWVNASQCNSKAAFFVIHEQSSRYCLYISLVMAQLPSCFSWKSCYFYSSSPFLPPPLTLLLCYASSFLYSFILIPNNLAFLKCSSKYHQKHHIFTSFHFLSWGGSLKKILWSPLLENRIDPLFEVHD